MRERIEYEYLSGWVVKSWLRYEYEGLNLLRIDQLYDGNFSGTIDSTDYNNDYWRPMNVYLHGPGAIGQIIKSKWFSYADDSTVTPCTTGEYYYFYDAVGNVVGVWDQRDSAYHSWAMDAFGNPLSGADFLAMDQPGPKEHLTGKMFDTVTGLYYFMARWYDPEVGRFVSRDKGKQCVFYRNPYAFVANSPMVYADPDGNEFRVITRLSVKLGINVFHDRCDCSAQEMEDVRASVREACSYVHRISDDNLRSCVSGFCETGVITCMRRKEGETSDSRYPTLGDNHVVDDPTDNSIHALDGGGSINLYIETINQERWDYGWTAIHEWGHGCNCGGGLDHHTDYYHGGRCEMLPYAAIRRGWPPQ